MEDRLAEIEAALADMLEWDPTRGDLGSVLIIHDEHVDEAMLLRDDYIPWLIAEVKRLRTESAAWGQLDVPASERLQAIEAAVWHHNAH